MTKLYITFLSLCTLLLASCGPYQQVTFSGIENMKLLKLSQNGVEAELTAKINNPNNKGFTIYHSEMDVTINGMNVGKAHLEKNVRIKRNSEDTYKFKIKSDFGNLSITDIPKIIAMAMSKTVKIELKGNLKAGKLFIKHSFPIDITKSVPLNLIK